MRFNIHTAHPVTGTRESFLYDNITSCLYTQNGSPVLSFPNKGVIRKNDNFDRAVYHKKIRQLRNLKIQVGLGCNLACRYCGQRNYVDTSERSVPIIPIRPNREPNIETFLVRLREQVDSVNSVVLLGGEPLLYMHRLVPLVRGLRASWPDARISTITNGTLLTREIADWLVDNRIHLFVSHDGPTSSLYRTGKNCFSDTTCLDAMRHYVDRSRREKLGLNLQISVVITPENTRLSDLQPWFEERLKRPCSLSFESIVRLNKKTRDSVRPFDSTSLGTLAVEVQKAFLNPDSGLKSFISKADAVASRLIARTDLRTLRFGCDVAQENVLSCDLFGNLLACAPYPADKTAYGEIEDSTNALCDVLIPWDGRNTMRCADCPFLVSCLGGCAFQTNENHAISCMNLKYWHAIVLMAAWFRLFGTCIESIEPIGG